MRRFFWYVVGLGACFFFVLSVVAREWTDTTGQNKAEATFIELADQTVRLKKPNGSIVSVPLSRLSKADRDYVLDASIERQDEIPMLSAQAQTAMREALDAVREDVARYAGQEDLDFDESEQLYDRTRPMLLQKLEALCTAAASRRAATPAIIAMLQDKNVAVRAMGVTAMNELELGAAAAGPALVRLLDDPSESVRARAADQLRRMAAYTDTHLPEIVKLIAGDDEVVARRAAQTLSGKCFPGPRAVIALEKLTALLKEQGRSEKSRSMIAAGLAKLVGAGDPDIGFAREELLIPLDIHDDRDDYALIRAMHRRLTVQKGKALQSVCREVKPLLLDDNLNVQRSAALILALHAPKDLAAIPGDVFVKLLTAENDESDITAGELMQVMTNIAATQQFPVRLEPAHVAELVRTNGYAMEFLIEQQLDLMGGDVKRMLPELEKLIKDDDIEVRLAAVRLLGSDYFADGDNLSNVPSVEVSVDADEQGRLTKIRCAGKPVANLAELSKSLAAATPAEPARAELTAEEILTRAVRDKDIADRAIGALADLNTPAATKSLRDMAKNSLDASIRQQARDLLEFAERRDFRHPVERKDPFAEPAAQPRRLSAAVYLAPSLRGDQLAPLLAALTDGKIMGVRLRTTGTDGATLLELQLQPGRDTRRDVEGSFCKLGLSRSEEDSLVVRFQALNSPKAKIAPDLRAVQFTLDFLVSMHFDRGSRSLERRRLGAGSVPATVDLSYDDTVLAGDVLQALAAVGGTDTQAGGPRDLLQWIRLQPSQQPTARWYLKVVQPPEKMEP